MWKPKREFDGTALAYCFKLLNTRERLLEHVRSVPLEASSETAQVLLAEAAALKEFSDQELPGIPQLAFQAQSLEGDPILQEVITGSGDSYLSAFIQQLGNSDWVKHALRYETEAHDKCPLCQQNLPPDFYAEVRKVFDKTYEERLDVLRQLEGRYRSGVEQFLRRCEAPSMSTNRSNCMSPRCRLCSKKNLQAIGEKIASPSLVTTLDSSVPLIAQLNGEIAAEQQKIDETNAKIKNRKQHEESIKQRFWKWYRGACNAFFVTFDKVERPKAAYAKRPRMKCRPSEIVFKSSRASSARPERPSQTSTKRSRTSNIGCGCSD